MRIVLATGGARSGKSRWAQARALELGGPAVTCVVTGVASDEEMARRIAGHRRERPAAWTTVEAATRAGAAVTAAHTRVVLLDCLSLLVAGVMLPAGDEQAALAAADTATDELLLAAASREGTLVVVTNEVGSGVVPTAPLGRWYRDALGRANQRVAAAAEEVVLLVAGVPLTLRPPGLAQPAGGL